MSESKDMLRVSTPDGKYTVVQDHTGKLFALRYNEPWRDCVGDNLVLALAYEVDELRSQLEQAENRECAWEHDEETGCYETQCKESIYFEWEMDPKFTKFCQCCGGKISLSLQSTQPTGKI